MTSVPRNLAKGQTTGEIRKKIAYKGEEATTEKEVTKKERKRTSKKREREREREREWEYYCTFHFLIATPWETDWCN